MRPVYEYLGLPQSIDMSRILFEIDNVLVSRDFAGLQIQWGGDDLRMGIIHFARKILNKENFSNFTI